MDAWADQLDVDPRVQFDRWFAEATAAGVRTPEAMTLATATADGVPSARMVLLKAHGPDGYLFYTNRQSRKGLELEANPVAALVLYWQPLDRQVRIEGSVERVDDETSAAYFASRPRGARLGALSSPQSRPVADREELERRYAAIDARHPGEEVPLPAFWGGYRVVPHAIEFWQGRDNRFHDRVRYERDGNGWSRCRLGP